MADSERQTLRRLMYVVLSMEYLRITLPNKGKSRRVAQGLQLQGTRFASQVAHGSQLHH